MLNYFTVTSFFFTDRWTKVATVPPKKESEVSHDVFPKPVKSSTKRLVGETWRRPSNVFRPWSLVRSTFVPNFWGVDFEASNNFRGGRVIIKNWLESQNQLTGNMLK